MSSRQAAVRSLMDETLGGDSAPAAAAEQARPAAVLVPLWDDGQRVVVVFTKRSGQLPHHAGQISFPGGMLDPEDPSPAQAALRETHEEIGVPPGRVALAQPLDELITVTGFWIHPFLGYLDPRASFQPAPGEVERIMLVPLATVLDPGAYEPTRIHWRGRHFLWRMSLVWEGEIIWGATGRILEGLLARLGPRAAEIAARAG